MREPTEELIRIVNTVNDMVYDQTGGEGLMLRPMLYSDDGEEQAIHFLGICLWTSDHQLEEEEDILGYLLKEVQVVLQTVKTIQLSKQS